MAAGMTSAYNKVRIYSIVHQIDGCLRDSLGIVRSIRLLRKQMFSLSMKRLQLFAVAFPSYMFGVGPVLQPFRQVRGKGFLYQSLGPMI